MTDSKEDSDLIEKAYQDEAAWNSAVRETRKKDPVSCGDLLRYGAVVKTWSKDPEKTFVKRLDFLIRPMFLWKRPGAVLI